MKQMIKNECKRTILSRGMVCSLVLGVAIVVWFQYNQVLFANLWVDDWCPNSLFYKWIGADTYPVQSYLYFFLIPLLAALPGGATLYEDMKGGYMHSILLRSGKTRYYMSKYIGTFLAGCIAVMLPLLLSLFLTAMKFPALTPEPIVDVGYSYSMLHQLYYTHPMLHLLIMLVLDCLMSGALATISLLFSFLTNHKTIVLIMPFILCYCVYCFQNIGTDTLTFSPNYFMIPGCEPKIWMEFIVSFVILFIMGCCYKIMGERYE